ncbi:hypothetical protein Agub_g15241, partial [Astrephomene gubernaculifera]
MEASTAEDASAAATATTLSHDAKEYGSGFSSGFLRFLDTGELADVVVHVVADANGTSPTPPSTSPSLSLPPTTTSSYPSSYDPSGQDYHLHSLILSRQSAFFAAALNQTTFADSASRRIRLVLDPAAAPAWPSLIRYFYSDRILLNDANALPLLALARQLLVSELDSYCTAFVRERMCAANCLEHLR